MKTTRSTALSRSPSLDAKPFWQIESSTAQDILPFADPDLRLDFSGFMMIYVCPTSFFANLLKEMQMWLTLPAASIPFSM